MKRRFVYREEEVRERPVRWAMVRRLLIFLAPHRGKVAIVLAATLVGTLARLTNPYLTARAIDLGIRPGNLRVLLGILGLMALNWLVNFAANRFRIQEASQVGQSVIYDLRGTLYRHIQSLSFQFFDQRPAGSIFVHVMNYVNALQNFYTNQVINVILDVMTLAGVTVVMMIMNWRLALLSFVTVPILILISTRLRWVVRRAWQVVTIRQSRLNAHLNEAIQGIRVTQAFGQEAENQSFFDWINGQNRDAWFRASTLGAMFGPMVEMTSSLGVALLYVYGARLIGRQELTVGELVAFAAYVTSFWDPINRLSNIYTQLLTVMANAEAIFELFDTKNAVPDRPGARPLPAIAGRVEFRDVVFAYEPDRPALSGINLSVRPGDTIALVGHTGSGKSTVINLLLRFYDVTGGRILIDGTDIRDVTAESLRRQVGVVLQDTFLFAGTIMENIRFGRPDATDGEVIASAKAARAHDFIMRFPNGYQEEVHERGSRLSMGQRQLIAIARAFLANPRILVLDEATANVDTQTEREIQAAIQRLLQGRTALVIAHRLSTIQEADQIVVLSHGRVVETGDHKTLLPGRTSGGAAPDASVYSTTATSLPNCSLASRKSWA